MDKNRIIIFDTTMRDGEQTPGVLLTKEKKVKLGRQLEDLGIDVIEAGFPANSKEEFKAVKSVAENVYKPIICGLARAIPSDIVTCWEAIRKAKHPRIHIFLSSSQIHIEKQLAKTPEEVLEMAVSAVKLAKSYCPDVEFSPMDSTRTEPLYLYKIIRATIDAGATTINIADTVGYIIPREFAALIRSIKDKNNVSNMERVVLSVHCHDDLGLAVANSLAAIEAGARQIEGCINGIGERAGNAALEEIIMALSVRSDYLNYSNNIDTTKLFPTSQLVEKLTKVKVAPNKAIIGENAFSHESGIHQDGMIKDKKTYEIISPEQVGRKGSKLVLGKTSGRAGLRDNLDRLGIDLSKDDLIKLNLAIKDLINKGKPITDEVINHMVKTRSFCN